MTLSTKLYSAAAFGFSVLELHRNRGAYRNHIIGKNNKELRIPVGSIAVEHINFINTESRIHHPLINTRGSLMTTNITSSCVCRPWDIFSKCGCSHAKYSGNG